MELIDGFDTLPEDAAEKVKRALEQGHVDDEDWNGVSLDVDQYSESASTNALSRTSNATATRARGLKECF